MQENLDVDKLPDEGDVPVSAALSQWPSVAAEGDSLVDAMDAMRRVPIGSLPVLADDGTFKGLLVRRDLMAALHGAAADSLTVGDVCRRRLCVDVDAPMRTALGVLEAEQVGRLPVIDGHELVGCVSAPAIQSFQESRRLFHEQHHVGDLSPHERAQLVWRLAQPTPDSLTWGMEITGEAFVVKAESYGAFDPAKAILEIGPGYGRLLRECLRRGLLFKKYVAVDISPANAKYLTEQFQRGDVEVVNDDIETVTLAQRFDVVLSSLTLKHLYPSFETALRNVGRHLNPGARVIFDLLEGDFSSFTPSNGLSYVRGYTRAGLEAMLPGISLQLIAFDEVEHAPGQVRLLVVAEKPTTDYA